ncbi:MAG: metal-dependent hydrolase [Desulfobacterales bacterium]
MTAPTHAAFGILWAALAGQGYLNATAAALGALVPDIDHPQSSIGRVFFFLSIPLNQKFGHRGFIHSFILYTPFVILGFFFSDFVLWLSLGAISHIVIDSYNVSGVKALVPFTQRTVICFKDDWRVRTGSTPEIFVFLVIGGLVLAMGYAETIGGARKLINLLARSHRITEQEYARAGLFRCEIEGRFRWQNGVTEDVRWLIVGSESGGDSSGTGKNLVCWDGKKLIREKHGRFLRSKLIESKQEWPIVKAKGIIRVAKPSFWMSGGKWHIAEAGQKAMGTVKSADGSHPEIEVADADNGWQKGLYPVENSDGTGSGTESGRTDPDSG